MFNLILKKCVNGHIANAVLIIWQCMKTSDITKREFLASEVFVLNFTSYIRKKIKAFIYYYYSHNEQIKLSLFSLVKPG